MLQLIDGYHMGNELPTCTALQIDQGRTHGCLVERIVHDVARALRRDTPQGFKVVIDAIHAELDNPPCTRQIAGEGQSVHPPQTGHMLLLATMKRMQKQALVWRDG